MRRISSTFVAISLLVILPNAGRAQAASPAELASTLREMRELRNDVVSGNNQLAGKLDVLHADLQALLKALQSGAPVATAVPAAPATTAVTTPAPAAPGGTGPTADTVTARFFPSDPGLADFPSPENSRVIRTSNGFGGRPYLLDSAGAVHRLEPLSATSMGYTVNGKPVIGGGGSPGDSNSTFMLLIERQGQVYAQRAAGQWQHFNPGGGSMYNAGLPDAWTTDTAGTTTARVAASTVAAPAPAARQTPAPGTSGRVLKTCANGCQYRSISAAITAAAAGDTVEIGAGTYKEAPPVWTVPLKIVFQPGASLDLTGLTRSLARGKGALVPAADSIIVNPVITGTAMDQGSAQGTAAIRPDSGCGYLDIQGGTLSGNQNGIAGGDVPVVVTVTNTKLDNNGLGDGYTHNIYMSHGTLSVTLTNVQSTNPNNGHAAKLRSYAVSIVGGSYDAFAAAAIDIPDGTVGQAVIDGATITKKAGAWNHTMLDYATEDTASGNGGLLIKNSTLDLLCESPAILVGGGSVVTIDTSTKIAGTKPTAKGGTVKGL